METKGFLTELKTERLQLAALSPYQIQLYLNQPERLEALLGFPVSRAVLTEPVVRALGIKLGKMTRVQPEMQPWYTYWLIVVRTPQAFGAGLAGFKGAPDGIGSAELGYGIDPAFQGKGYMTETVCALVDWAFNHPTCRTVTAVTLKVNYASIRVLEKVGFARVGSDSNSLFWDLPRSRWQAPRLRQQAAGS
jgi:[ribosomal protein S5]-alanine N-acetyltransferase